MNTNVCDKQYVRSPGRLYGLGLGPGDPELLTIKALRILREVDTIFVPRKGDRSASFARAILSAALEGISDKVVEITFPMRKENLEEAWEDAARTIWAHLSQGENCAFLTEGDPFLYGTFNYIFTIFREKYPEVALEVVPGISSVNAASARALFPLSSGAEKVAILPATYDPIALTKTLEDFDTVVLMKVYNVFDQVLDVLEEKGLTNCCTYVKRATTSEEEIVTDIRRLRGKKLDYFSLLIVRRQHGR